MKPKQIAFSPSIFFCLANRICDDASEKKRNSLLFSSISLFIYSLLGDKTRTFATYYSKKSQHINKWIWWTLSNCCSTILSISHIRKYMHDTHTHTRHDGVAFHLNTIDHKIIALLFSLSSISFGHHWLHSPCLPLLPLYHNAIEYAFVCILL